MWQIPIPNWTGLLAFCPGTLFGLFAAYMLGWWLNKREKPTKSNQPDYIGFYDESDEIDEITARAALTKPPRVNKR